MSGQEYQKCSLVKGTGRSFIKIQGIDKEEGEKLFLAFRWGFETRQS